MVLNLHEKLRGGEGTEQVTGEERGGEGNRKGRRTGKRGELGGK